MKKSPSAREQRREKRGAIPEQNAAETLETNTVADVESLWKRASGGNDVEAVEQLVKHYSPIATFVARAHFGRGLDQNYLLDQARHGLRVAVTSYDPKRSEDFSAFAPTVVRNHLRTQLREASYLSRQGIEQSRTFTDAESELTQKLGRSPKDDEVYDRLDWSRTERANHRAARNFGSPLRFDSEHPPSCPCRPRSADPGVMWDNAVTTEALHAELHRLDDVSRQVIVQRYLDCDKPSQKETARRLGMTEYRVRTIEKEALATLREKLQGTEAAS